MAAESTSTDRRSDAGNSHANNTRNATGSAGTAGPDADAPLSCFSFHNVQGLKPRTVPTKVPYIRDLLHESNQLFTALTETWLRDHEEAELKIDNYKIYRSDRVRKKKSQRGRDSGGVAIYLRDDLVTTAKEVLKFSTGVIEVLGVHVKSLNLVIIVVYRQPDDTVGGHRSTHKEFKTALGEIKKCLENLQSPSPDVIMGGDFNMPNVNWPDATPTKKTTKEVRLMLEDLDELTAEQFLLQYITKPTHKDGNTLDLCFTNNAGLIHSYQCDFTITSHHSIVRIKTSLKAKPTEETTFRQPNTDDGPGSTFDSLNFFSEDANWLGLSQKLKKTNWSEVLGDPEHSDPEQMMHKLIQKCAQESENFIPKRKTTEKRKSSRIPRVRRNLMRRRTKVNKKLSTPVTPSQRDKLTTELIDIERNLQKSYKAENSEMEHKAVDAIKKNSKYFFSYARKFSKVTVGIGPLIGAAANIISCPLKMAEMLVEQYCKVFSTPKEPLREPQQIFTDQNMNGPEICDFDFTIDDLVDAISEISPTAAAGPDRFPAKLLKECKMELSVPLYTIWRRSLDTGQVPQTLKTAHIIPVYKGGCRGTPKNYRPVALTSHLIKVFEKVIRRKIVMFMETYQLFNPSQHGFRAGRSCLSQLLSHYDRILELLEEGVNVDVIYLDFAKAFDKVDFGVTLTKLNEMGIRGKIGQWIYSFLTNRSQTVLVNQARSTQAEVKSGVPQGSVLGPLLFLVLIGDIDKDIAAAFLSSFADDTRVGSGINCVQDTVELQADLTSVYEWTSENNMELHGDKFELLRYGDNAEIKSETQYTSNTGLVIKEEDQVRDLGVTMHSSGSFSPQIQKLVAEGRKQCGWILRTFNTRDTLPMLTLWKSLVMSRLEYCSQLWCPLKKGEIQALEMVQRTFLRKITRMSELSYWEQLKKLNMYSLERRRERYRIIYVWKVLENLVPNIGNDRIRSKTHQRRGRECFPPKVNQYCSRKVQNLIYASLPVHGQQLFNCLPKEIRNLTKCEVTTFKGVLDQYLMTVPDEPLIRGYERFRRAESNSLLDMTKFTSKPGDSLLDATESPPTTRCDSQSLP